MPNGGSKIFVTGRPYQVRLPRMLLREIQTRRALRLQTTLKLTPLILLFNSVLKLRMDPDLVKRVATVQEKF